MRKVNASIESIVDQIKNLKGQNIDLEINRGRKKTVKYTGIIENIYPSIFTVRNVNCYNDSSSYSYADVLCGAVSFKECSSNKESINLQ